MEQRFFERPILNSPYEYPPRHWELDENRQPTNRIVERRRSVSFITPIRAARHSVDEWRMLPRAKWRVTPDTARLLHHWRHHQFSDVRPFFCQAVWLEPSHVSQSDGDRLNLRRL